MLTASSEGDLETMKDLASRQPGLVRCEYNYTPPIHFAVWEGHAPVVSWLIEQGVDLSYRSYSFKDALLQLAREREYHDILQILEDAWRIESATTGWNCCRLLAAATTSALTNWSQKHRSWSTPATTRGDSPARGLLRETPATIDALRADGHRRIHSALERHHHELSSSLAIAGYLLGQGAEYNILLVSTLTDRAAGTSSSPRIHSWRIQDGNGSRPAVAVAGALTSAGAPTDGIVMPTGREDLDKVLETAK